MSDKAKNISELNPEAKRRRIEYMAEKTAEYLKVANTLSVSISKGNRKTNALVPSVSLRPILDCKNCGVCNGLCYDVRNDCMYKAVMNTRARNFAIWKTDPERYFNEISIFCQTQVAFRWHIGGDIVNMEYLEGMARVARQNKHCKFLAFTKRFDLVNKYLDTHHKPGNLQIIFSGWIGLDVPNPHNLPMSHPVFKDGRTTAKPTAKNCGGDCSHCLTHCEGCWTLKKGEEVKFYAH